MITSTCAETSVQSLPAPAATLCPDLTPAVPVSSPSYSREKLGSHVSQTRTSGAAPGWTVWVFILIQTGASAMKTALPLSPDLTSAHKIQDYTCAETSVQRSGNLVMDPALLMITPTGVGTSVQSLPAPAATLCQGMIFLAVPASSPSYLRDLRSSHVWKPL